MVLSWRCCGGGISGIGDIPVSPPMQSARQHILCATLRSSPVGAAVVPLSFVLRQNSRSGGRPVWSNQPIQYQSNMGHTKQSQKITRAELDEKLSLSIPSRELLEELAVACAEDPTPDKTFQYAFCLSKSRQESELRYAVTILDSLVKEGYEHQIDCMIGSATALYLLGDFEEGQ